MWGREHSILFILKLLTMTVEEIHAGMKHLDDQQAELRRVGEELKASRREQNIQHMEVRELLEKVIQKMGFEASSTSGPVSSPRRSSSLLLPPLAPPRSSCPPIASPAPLDLTNSSAEQERGDSRHGA